MHDCCPLSEPGQINCPQGLERARTTPGCERVHLLSLAACRPRACQVTPPPNSLPEAERGERQPLPPPPPPRRSGEGKQNRPLPPAPSPKRGGGDRLLLPLPASGRGRGGGVLLRRPRGASGAAAPRPRPGGGASLPRSAGRTRPVWPSGGSRCSRR